QPTDSRQPRRRCPPRTAVSKQRKDHSIMLRNLRLQSIGMAALCLLVLGAGQLRAADVPAARRLPPGVLLYLSVPDAVDLKDRFMDSNFGQMIEDDSLNEFRGQFSEHWQEASKKVQE